MRNEAIKKMKEEKSTTVKLDSTTWATRIVGICGKPDYPDQAKHQCNEVKQVIVTAEFHENVIPEQLKKNWEPTDVDCPDCHMPLKKVNSISGTETDSECDPACRGAKKDECNCSCGGANHGIEHI